MEEIQPPALPISATRTVWEILEILWALGRMTFTAIGAVVWTVPRFLASKVVSVAMAPVRWCMAVVATVTWPVRYVVGAVVGWVLDEFEALIIFLCIAALIGFTGGMFLRLISVGAIKVLAPSDERGSDAGDGESERSEGSRRLSEDSDYSFTERRPVMYKSSGASSSGAYQALARRSLLGETIHEEDDSD